MEEVVINEFNASRYAGRHFVLKQTINSDRNKGKYEGQAFHLIGCGVKTYACIEAKLVGSQKEVWFVPGATLTFL